MARSGWKRTSRRARNSWWSCRWRERWRHRSHRVHSVLVVDDERDIRESLRGVLEDEGYKVLLAESGEACLEQLKKRSCEAVLLDIWLPGIDGLETLERIRQLRPARSRDHLRPWHD